MAMRLIDVERYVAGLNMSIADAQVKYAGDKVMAEVIGILRLVRDMAIHQPTVDAVALPCKIGAPVYIVCHKWRAGREEWFINTGKFGISDLEKIGKTVFLSQEDAERTITERRTQ